MSAAEVLSRARDVLTERGWHQGAFSSELIDPNVGSVCAWGAINTAMTGDPRCWTPGAMRVVRILEDVIDASVSFWNDAPERTYEDVVLALKRAEERAEAAA